MSSLDYPAYSQAPDFDPANKYRSSSKFALAVLYPCARDVQLLAKAVRESLLPNPACKRLEKRQAKQLVFASGARADSVYFIEANQIKLERSTNANASVMLGIRGSDELVGEEGAVVGQSLYCYSATMLTSGVVWAIPTRVFTVLCDERPESGELSHDISTRRKPILNVGFQASL